MTTDSPEAVQPEDWAGEMGDKWNRNIDQLESMITSVGNAAIEFAGFKRGENVVDIGCGGGPTTLQIAELVGDNGHVTGVDLSPNLVQTALSRKKDRGVSNVDFVAGDAAQLKFERRYDCLFSRFGVMFFNDPYAAFKNLASAVTPGGRAAICCWGPPQANAWISELTGVVSQFVELPKRDPRDPGPFSLSDKDYLCDILEKAGFHDIKLTIWKGDLYLGGIGADADTATEFAFEATPVGSLLADAPEETLAAAADAVKELLRSKETPNGVVLKGTAWFVAANAD